MSIGNGNLLKEIIKVLQFYADKNKYDTAIQWNYEIKSMIIEDHGSVARKMLEQLKNVDYVQIGNSQDKTKN